jgi:hypothetical protein
MLRKRFLAVACTLAVSGSVWADTPVGPGATGIGGTGPNAADAKVRDREGGTPPQRRDGMPVDQADANIRANAGAATQDARTGQEGIGSTSDAGASSKRSAVQKERKADED